MKGIQIQGMEMTEVVADRCASWLHKKSKGDRRRYLKMKLGFETLFINLSKMVVVYAVALWFQIFLATLLFHLSYYTIRRTSYGRHAGNSLMCSLISIVIFVGIPYVAPFIVLPTSMIILLFLINGWLIYKFAPSFTTKNRIPSRKKQLKLRNQSLGTCIIIMAVTLMISDSTAQTLLTSGATLASLLTIPNNIVKWRKVT
ncbi:accessory gene regulator AgrB [Halobacillus litoralis]|uniref:AgrB-like protein n=1 Tax=Halobacillus litoralis TaxID=45668 RepID=A0A410MC13_9BACI|nr:accessory gene regulator AgrB [Halobacillus litoralis]QAS52230.1 hypothetical protein HLI_08300 [Halobacillus litoralis]